MQDEEIIQLNRPQIKVHLVNANNTYVLWGRATGKTNGAVGPRTVHLFNQMPGGQIGLIVPTYEMAFRTILPNIIGFWQNQMQLVEGEDFVFGTKPPDDWAKPIIPIKEFKYVVSFNSGSVMPIISLAVEGAGNGFSLQAVMGDEAKFFNEKKLKEILRARRGCYTQFGHLPEFQSQWYFTDKYGGDIQWMLKKRELMKPAAINAVIKMQLHVNKLSLQPGNDALINHYNKLLTAARKNMVFVSEASAYENADILGEKFFKDQKEDSTDLEFKIAIGNEDPDKVENCFYHQLGEQHYYSKHNDVDVNQPLIIAADYQWRISPIVQAQYNILPGADKVTLNFNYSCYVLHPELLEDAVDKWAFHNRYHINKLVYYVFDKTATEKSSTSKQPYKVVTQRLQYQ